jgi:hypothetical protein
MLKENMSKVTEEKESKIYGRLSVFGVLAAIFIIVYVLFSSPMPGVADQGDFERVMNVSGLLDIQNAPDSPEPHWFKYVTTKYKMHSLGLVNSVRLTGVIPTTSMIYPIFFARIISKVFGGGYFRTNFLAAVYAILYVFALFMVIRWVKLKNKATAIFFSIISLVFLLDGSYLIWFNSIYGEAMITVSLILFAGTVLYVIQNSEKLGYKGVIIVFISALLFLGSKLQCFVALPIVILMFVRIALFQEKRSWKAIFSPKVFVPVLLLTFYVGGIYIQINSGTGSDTEFNSVFYGVLKNSDDPEKDLEKLGLATDMAGEAGKHAYQSKEDYVKYVPGTELTKREFNDKMSNLKLLRFYISNPSKLLKGMELTASKAFDTVSSLGKYEKSALEEYTHEFHRFTLWSDFRSTKIPKTLGFIIPFYIIVILISVMEYRKNIEDKRICLIIELFWSVMLIGILQFPLPYVGNGEADIAKQLFLFNFTFDIICLISITWSFEKINALFKRSW